MFSKLGVNFNSVTIVFFQIELTNSVPKDKTLFSAPVHHKMSQHLAVAYQAGAKYHDFSQGNIKRQSGCLVIKLANVFSCFAQSHPVKAACR